MKIFKAWLLVLCWMGTIFYFSSRQRVQISDVYSINFVFFKTLHVLEYALLFLFSYRAVKISFRQTPVRFWGIYGYVVTIIYAMTDELHQMFVPTREGRLRDVIIDAVGGLIAWYLIRRILPKAPKKLRSVARNWGIG